jgi:hypothetical protein
MFLLLALLVLIGAPMVCAQVETAPQPAAPQAAPEVVAPHPVPLVGPGPNPDTLDKTVVLDGRLRVVWRAFDNHQWRYRFANGTADSISSFSMVVPEKYYDSRIVPDVPTGWVERRERGEGALQGNWVLSYFATDQASRLKRGHWMEIGLLSGASLLEGDRKAVVSAGVTPGSRLLYPWDKGYFPFKAPFTDLSYKAEKNPMPVPYPSLSFLPVPGRVLSVEKALAKQAVSVVTVGQGVHFGHVFQMTLRSPNPLVARLDRGTVMVPSIGEYDVMILGRAERLMLAPHATATIALHGYSISYGRKAPPPRLVLHDLEYRFPTDVPEPAIARYRQILERSTRLTPDLSTPLGANYFDTVVQYAIWRAERLMESNPLSVRDVERDLSQVYFWRQTLKGPIRVYLQPLAVYDLAKRVWSDTDQLLYEEHPEIIP